MPDWFDRVKMVSSIRRVSLWRSSRTIGEMRRPRELQLGCVGVVGEGGAVDVCLDYLVDGRNERGEVGGLSGRGDLDEAVGYRKWFGVWGEGDDGDRGGVDVRGGIQKAGAGNSTCAFTPCGGWREGDGKVATAASENTVDSGVLLNKWKGGSVPLVDGNCYCMNWMERVGCEGHDAGCGVELVRG
jgi:hypothetical protein